MEPARELRDVGQGNFEVFAKVRELILLQSADDALNDDRVASLVDLVHNLVFALQVNGAAHQN